VGAFEFQGPIMPSPTPTLTPPNPTPTPSCTPANRLQDSGLEASTSNGSNPFWSSTSTNFGTAICSVAACGTGSNGQALPRAGTYWAWFGGVDGPETAKLSQKFTIPAGAQANLHYYLKVSRVYSPFTDTLHVKVDGNPVQTINEPGVEENTYSLRSVNLAGYADGVEHTLLFEFTSPAGGKASSFNVDDVTLDVQCATPSPSPTPTPVPSVTPTFTPSPTPLPCTAGNKVKDPSLEASSAGGPPFTNPFWFSSSDNFGTSICKSSVCGSGSNGQALPRTGNYWAWFGGVPGPERGSLSQKITIPKGAQATLRYYVKVSKVYPPYSDSLTVALGHNRSLDVVREPFVADANYVLRTVNLNGFADGNEYGLDFSFNAPDIKASSFNVDDITIDVQCPGAGPDDIDGVSERESGTERPEILIDGAIGGEFLPDLPKRALGFEKAGAPPKMRIREQFTQP